MDDKQIIAANQTAYARIVERWEEKWNADDERFHEPCRQLFLEHLRGERVADLGCGLGRDSLFFAGRGLRVTAVDLVAGFLPAVRTRNPSIAAAAMDLTAPAFAAGCFDGVYLFASFLHIPHRLSQAVLTGLATLLRPGGLLFMQHVQSLKGFDSYRVDNLLVDDNPAFCYCHREERMLELLERTGLVRSRLFRLDPPGRRSPLREQYGLQPYQVIAFAPE